MGDRESCIGDTEGRVRDYNESLGLDSVSNDSVHIMEKEQTSVGVVFLLMMRWSMKARIRVWKRKP